LHAALRRIWTSPLAESKIRLDLRALVYREADDDAYLAHCLELDVAEQGPTPADALASLQAAVDALVEHAIDEGLETHLYKPAPAAYWQAYFAAQAVAGITAQRKDALDKEIAELIGGSVVWARSLHQLVDAEPVGPH